MSIGLPAALAVSLLLTLIFETGFFRLAGKRDQKDLLLVVWVNVLTNPAVVLLYSFSQFHTALPPVPVIAALELVAIAAEGYYYKKYGKDFTRPYLFSAAANALSFGMGMLVQQFI